MIKNLFSTSRQEQQQTENEDIYEKTSLTENNNGIVLDENI